MKALDYSIRWSYRHIPISTYCDIYKENLPFPVGSGEAICHFTDQFCKETGRKISLARAMRNALLTKETRTLIWDEYRNTKKGGRW